LDELNSEYGNRNCFDTSARILLAQGAIASSLGEHLEARRSFDKATDVARTAGYRGLEIRGRVGTAEASLDLGRFRLGASILSEQIDAATAADILPTEVEARIALARAQMRLGGHSSAIATIRKAVQVAGSHNMRPLLLRALVVQRNALKGKGDSEGVERVVARASAVQNEILAEVPPTHREAYIRAHGLGSV
jgi:hypothetical protein